MARLEKTVGNVKVVISESVGQRVWKEELTIRDFNGRNLNSTNFRSIMNTVTVRAGPTRPANVLNQQTGDLLDSSNVIFALANTQRFEVGEQEFDTRISAEPTKCDLNNINLTTMKLMEQHQVSPKRNPLSYLWVANCVLYSVVMAFLLNKGEKKQRRGTSG